MENQEMPGQSLQTARASFGTLSFYGSGYHAFNDGSLHQQVEYHQWERGQNQHGKEGGPVGGEGPYVFINLLEQNSFGGILEKQEGRHEVIPYGQGVQDGNRGNDGLQEGKHDPEKYP